jgi:hypothetical protein
VSITPYFPLEEAKIIINGSVNDPNLELTKPSTV